MQRFACPYLQGHVELTDERAVHISAAHPGMQVEWIAAVLANPGEVRRDERYGSTRLFSGFFPDVLGGKHIVVAVVTDPPLGAGASPRHWVVTAYPARELTQGATEWKQG